MSAKNQSAKNPSAEISSATAQSAQESLAFLRRCVPRFDVLRRAASGPGPVARFLLARRLPSTADPKAVVAALRLVQQEDRAFCRAVHLDGWREASNEENAVFRLEDEGGMLWPVAARALVLFAGASAGEGAPRRLVPPGGDASFAAEPAGRRFTVRTESRGDGEFRVVVR